MAKKKAGPVVPDRRAIDLFPKSAARRRRALILPRYLAEEAGKAIHRGKARDDAHEILKKWAKLEVDGHIFQKETAIDAQFLVDVFGDALGHRTLNDSPEDFQLQRNFTVPDVGTADGALGLFSPSNASSPRVVIELKNADCHLDRDKFNGRTAVQQCWDYLNALPECPWGIVSNFVTIRLYHRDKTPLAYEEFRLRDLVDDQRFRDFYCLFEVGGLVRPVPGFPTRAISLLRRTDDRQREVGDKLYEQYSGHRAELISHLCDAHKKPLDTAIRIAQKILDRIIFVAFCEDRGLLPEKCIEDSFKTLPPFTKVRNPKWQNFLNLFHAIDKGHERFALETGYNGGLFEHDDEVDNLQLDDSWTNFFNTVGGYDFRDEVNVEVLGHIFERSITELERMRSIGSFLVSTPVGASPAVEPAMRKSAARKRFGTYYTPIQFTQFIVRETVGQLIDERFARARQAHGLEPQQLEAEKPPPAARDYWRDCLDVLRSLKVCDFACGSGAFLIQAYDALDERYQAVVEHIVELEGAAAEGLIEAVPDTILGQNLYGVDLSHEAVEITQLALWLRSAQRGKTLADLSHNIVCGNSLVTDPAVDERALIWETRFPEVFNRPEHGFDCVIGNPPWERLKLQEREFFAFTAPEIAGAVSAATRRQLIAKLEQNNPELFGSYLKARDAADRTLAHVRTSGQFPLTGKGDVNTYAVFAELARSLVAPHGRVGVLVPSAIGTDNTTKDFFGQLIESESLVSLFDFENKAPVFPDVHRSFKFCTLVFGGSDRRTKAADFAFFARQMEDLDESKRHIPLTAADLRLLNPNTRTCPIFRSRRDADLTRAVYKRVPILVDHTRRKGGNPWGVKFVRMFDQTNDAELFHDEKQLRDLGSKLQGNRWKKGKRTFLPLYEAKMIQAYDHRAASVLVRKGNWVRQGQTEATTQVQHANPEFSVQPRWWVEENRVAEFLGDRVQPAYLAYKDVTSATNQRTMIAAMVPHVAVVNSAPLLLLGSDISPRLACCLLANLNSFALDFFARQKVGSVHLNFFIVEQLPLFPPDRYAGRCPWDGRKTLERWISDRVLKLTCTAEDMQPFAEAAGFTPLIHKWRPDERATLMAELDAAFFLLYGIDRNDVEYILGTFQGTSQEDALLFRVDASVLDAYDKLSPRRV